jgi:hypothetical protein
MAVAEGSVATEGGEKGAKKPRRLSFEAEYPPGYDFDADEMSEDEFEADYFDSHLP